MALNDEYFHNRPFKPPAPEIHDFRPPFQINSLEQALDAIIQDDWSLPEDQEIRGFFQSCLEFLQYAKESYHRKLLSEKDSVTLISNLILYMDEILEIMGLSSTEDQNTILQQVVNALEILLHGSEIDQQDISPDQKELFNDFFVAWMVEEGIN
jgi:hypothetical protein